MKMETDVKRIGRVHVVHLELSDEELGVLVNCMGQGHSPGSDNPHFRLYQHLADVAERHNIDVPRESYSPQTGSS